MFAACLSPAFDTSLSPSFSTDAIFAGITRGRRDKG
jgi:hypothetical protein